MLGIFFAISVPVCPLLFTLEGTGDGWLIFKKRLLPVIVEFLPGSVVIGVVLMVVESDSKSGRRSVVVVIFRSCSV